MDVSDWLRGLGFPQYISVFQENEIDSRALRELTREDLDDLGITIVGHRRRLLTAIAELRDQAAAGAEVLTPPSPGDAPRTAVERRQLTVMFCDLVGSTALAARLDPEDLRALMSQYRRCIADTVARHNGFVAQHLGDGALVYFGYPQAQENDTERAVLGALDLVNAISTLPATEKLQARIGIATGLVVVGDLSESEGVTEHGALGETPNLAARLQALAHPGTVVISGRTRQITGSLFRYRDLGETVVAGFSEPVRAWEVLGATAAASRSQVLESADMSPLVGRDEEIELLSRRWERAKGGDGRVVLLSGEAGIGKSRITLGFLEHLSKEAKSLLRLFCSPYHANSAFYPIITALEHTSGIVSQDTAEQKLLKLDQALSDAMSAADLALLGELLSILPRTPLEAMSPQVRRENLMRIFLERIASLAASKPLLVLLEDAHWLDPTSLDLLDRLVEQVRLRPILLVVTGRPEFQPSWAGQAFVTVHALNRLGEAEVVAIVSRMAGERTVSRSLVEQIIARTDGVPLYVEELTKTILESSSLGHEGELSEMKIPATLQASLVARLDRLALAKDIAQIGATIGREFSYELLSLVTEVGPKELQAALDQLVGSGLANRRGDIPHAQFVFKHALVQEAAYETLLRSRRQQLHARIGNALELHHAGLAETQPEILARHFSEAGISERAVKYWLQAGRIAAGRSANLEAASHASRGLSELKQLPASRERDAEELEVRLVLGPALIATKGYSAEETVQNYERARQIIPYARRSEFGDMALTGLYVALYNRAEHRKALEVGEELVKRAELSRNPLSLSAAHRTVAATQNVLGRFEAARSHAQVALQSFDFEQHSAVDSRFVHDLGVGAACHLAIPLWHLGEIDQATVLEERALARVKMLNHHNTTGFGVYYAGALSSMRRRDFAGLAEHTWRLQAHGRQHNLPQWVAWGAALEGLSLAHAGKIPDGITRTEEGIQLCEKIKNAVMRPVFLPSLCEMYMMAGNLLEAAKALEEAVLVAQSTEERWVDAEHWRLRGELALARDGNAGTQADEYYGQGIETARAQGSRMFVLRLTTSRARLWVRQGKADEARASVRAALTGIVGGKDAPDVKQAQSLVSGLA